MVVALIALMSLETKDLLTNGNFEAGAKGFSTEYQLSDDIVPVGTVSVIRNPHDVHPVAGIVHDHTSNGGFLLAVNGGPDPKKAFWIEKVKVEPNHTYRFTMYASSWGTFTNVHNEAIPDESPARIVLTINGKRITSAWTLKGTSNEWEPHVIYWRSGSDTTATLRLSDDNTDAVGNDFTLDDISFKLRD